MSWNIKLLLSLSLFLTGHMTAVCQISGTINIYTKVTAVDYLCNFITVNSTTGFAAGDKVLLIQMQGATITQTNTVNFGDITNIEDAGNYEFASIDHFAGNNVYFSKTLLRTYTVSGSVQMINVPQYSDLSIDGELIAKTWDGNTGGVIVLESTGTITLNANINVSEQGFRGGAKSLAGGDCFGASLFNYSFPTVSAGQKGEGISNYIGGKESGRAKNSTGGGGGSSHNTGGAGGANYGAGGRGGDKTSGCSNTFYPNPYGLASVGLGSTYYNATDNKIFMGGGGGGGQQNNGMSYNGGNGGGIIIVKAATLAANGYSIKSNGGTVASNYSASAPVTTDNGDGNSGGGAGGSILLDILNYTGTTTLEAKGGTGGNTGYQNSEFGPGGGGGGGILWLSTSPTSLLINVNVAAGTAGISGSGLPSYGSGTTWGAMNGTAGATLNSLSIPEGSSTSSCALPVELLSFQAKANGKYSVQLNWTTATELNNDHFSLEKSTDGIHFSLVTTIRGLATSHQLTNYSFTDEVAAYSLLYYRLKQTDIDGHTVDLGIRKVYAESEKITDVSVYPNPCKNQLHIQLLSPQKETVQHLVFVNSTGEMIDVNWEETSVNLLINTSTLSNGLYSLIIYTREHRPIIKVLKEE